VPIHSLAEYVYNSDVNRIKIIDTTNNKNTGKILKLRTDKIAPLLADYENGFYVIVPTSATPPFVIIKKGEGTSIMASYNHLTNSIIRHIILEPDNTVDTVITREELDDSDSTKLKLDMMLFMIYSKAAVYAALDADDKRAKFNQLVLSELTKLISTLVDKRNTTYKDSVELVDKYIDILRDRMNIEVLFSETGKAFNFMRLYDTI